MTTLLSMTVSASVVIAVIIVIRSLFVHRLPKRLFVILWTAAALRMLVPFLFPLIFHMKIHSLKTLSSANSHRRNPPNRIPKRAAHWTVN